MEVVFVGRPDAPTTAAFLDSLRGAGHDVRVVETVGEAELAVRTRRVDAALVDGDPAPLRRRIGDVPVGAWLATASTARSAELLEAGADDVLHPGMGERERLARVAVLGRRAPRAEPAVEVGPLRVDRDRGEATWHGRRLQLTPRERDVLHVLAAAQGATVRREALYREVWGYAMARGDRTVDVNVRRLREKLAAAVGPPLTIETEPSVGYRLVVAGPAVTAL